jgi:acyl-CoA reductase-like NAD-dependent aldehyde dehydrogenase
LVSEQSESKLIAAMKQVLKEFFPPDARGDKASANRDSADPSDSKFCKIINQRHFDRLNSYLSQTKGEIVKLELNSSAQPESADPASLKIPLTLIRNVQHDDVLMENELFGPLLPILTYNNDHEDIVQCLHRISQSAPLALYAFGQSEEKLEFGKPSPQIRMTIILKTGKPACFSSSQLIIDSSATQ